MQSDLCPNVRRPHFAVVRSCPPPHICLSCGHQSPDIYPPGHPRHLTTVRYSEPQTSPRPVMCPACGLLPLDIRCLDISLRTSAHRSDFTSRTHPRTVQPTSTTSFPSRHQRTGIYLHDIQPLPEFDSLTLCRRPVICPLYIHEPTDIYPLLGHPGHLTPAKN